MKVAPASALASTKHKAIIQLQVIPDGAGGFKLQKTGRLKHCMAPAPNPDPEGCIHVPETDTATITFKLNASPGWHLTQIKICQDGTPCTLTVPQTGDFCFSKVGQACDPGMNYYPGNDGIFELKKLDSSLQKFELHDRNTVKQDYEYTIEACKDGDCTTQDPPLENGGLK
jgi:hypothetical protein